MLEWFMKDHVTQKTVVMMLKIQLCHHRNKLHFKIYLNRKQCFLLFFVMYFFIQHLWTKDTQMTVFVYLSNFSLVIGIANHAKTS